jgi:flagellar protein FlaG
MVNALSPLGSTPASPVVTPPAGHAAKAPASGQANGAAAAQQQAAATNAGSNASNRQHLEQALEKVSKVVNLYNSELKFTVDPDTNSNVVKVIDKQTDQVIRQIPSEEMLKIAQNLDKIVGLFVENKA